MTNARFLRELGWKLNDYKPRSCWLKGVQEYASEMVESLQWSSDCLDEDFYQSNRLFERACLNGASDWSQYSWGGCALIFDEDIAKRLCNKSELKRTDNGRKEPNWRESWLDVQARALFQAFNLLDSYRVQIIKGQ